MNMDVCDLSQQFLEAPFWTSCKEKKENENVHSIWTFIALEFDVAYDVIWIICSFIVVEAMDLIYSLLLSLSLSVSYSFSLLLFKFTASLAGVFFFLSENIYCARYEQKTNGKCRVKGNLFFVKLFSIQDTLKYH